MKIPCLLQIYGCALRVVSGSDFTTDNITIPSLRSSAGRHPRPATNAETHARFIHTWHVQNSVMPPPRHPDGYRENVFPIILDKEFSGTV